jgi:acetyltransferase-like isoleucine patch superfamily enzyme
MVGRLARGARRVARGSRRVLQDPERLPWELWYRHGGRLRSELHRRAILATHRHCTVEFGAGTHIGPGFSLDIPHSGTFIAGPDVEFRRGFHCEVSGAGRVVIGRATSFTNDCLIQCTTVVEIGELCGIGQSVLIVDGGHNYRDWTRDWREQGFRFNDVRIGNSVIIGGKATIIGTTVGDHAVIGASSVVTRPVPAYCVAVGAPARVIEYFGPPDLRPEGLDVRRER